MDRQEVLNKHEFNTTDTQLIYLKRGVVVKQHTMLPFTYPGHPLKRCGIFFCSILITLLLVSAAGAVTGVTISSQEPVVGDNVIVRGYGTPNSELTANTSFTVEVPVDEGFYKYELNNIKVPEGTDTFSVEAQKVIDLNVTVKKFGIPYSRSSTADGNGFAKISQSYVLPFTYKVAISGQAPGTEDTVNLTLKGTSTIQTGPDGYFECSYKTNTVPAGLFIVEIEEQTFEIELLEKKAAKGKSSGKTGTELAIVPATQLTQGTGQGTDNEAGPEENETQLEAAPDDVLPEETVTGTIDTQPQPGIFQSMINWLKGLFK